MVHVAVAYNDSIKVRKPPFGQPRGNDAPATVEKRCRITAAIHKDASTRILQQNGLPCTNIDHGKRDPLFQPCQPIFSPARQKASNKAKNTKSKETLERHANRLLKYSCLRHEGQSGKDSTIPQRTEGLWAQTLDEREAVSAFHPLQ